jgi:hypothetical protein
MNKTVIPAGAISQPASANKKTPGELMPNAKVLAIPF